MGFIKWDVREKTMIDSHNKIVSKIEKMANECSSEQLENFLWLGRHIIVTDVNAEELDGLYMDVFLTIFEEELKERM
jgi:hypothetical protein